jgi:hypothetical protein
MFMHPITRPVIAAALAFMLAGPLLAQDGVVPADKEPRHVPKLVNEWVRIVDVEIALDNERVGAYRIKLAPGASIGPLTISGPSIRVAMDDGKLLDESGDTQTETRLAPAQFVFQPQATTATFTNVGGTELELVEFVLK